MDIIQTLDVLKCKNCNSIINIPKHCGKPMNLENGNWVCWKGEHTPCCGRDSIFEFESCCENPQI